ncbi:hypothetical protein KDW_61080 [Dictyobacter vulcani]|uniref:Uncharacterized protein n=1 Tax=Dictyobacter vulcani TaxID=2607529 RepID=A0A5J4L3A8_9CHLR|nr:hypothetical protein [Dictyobacter vulcani]GER91946.1 hypothetical protein KDW_61080 [Dictyobacter vulcani]
MKCPTCCPEPNDYISSNNGLEILRGVKSYKPALTRLSNWAHHYYRTALQEGAVPCCVCGHMIPLRFHRPEYASTWLRQSGVPVIYLYCEHCHSCFYNALDHLALSLPELQQFRRNHPRIRTLPAVYDDVNGGHAMITRYESMTSAEHVEVVTSLENYRVLNIVGGQA